MAGTSNEPTTDTSGPPTTVFTYPGGRSRCSTALAIERLARLVATLSLHHFVPLNDAFAQAKNHLGSYSLAAHDFTQHARARRLTLAVRVIWPDRTEQAFILRSTFWRWHEIYNGLRSGADPPQRDWATVRQVRGNPASMLGQWYVFVGRRRFERLYSVSTPSKSTPKARSGGPSGASRKIPEQPPNTAKEFVPYAVGRWPRRKDEGAGEYVGRSPIAARAPKMVAAYNSEPVVGAESGLVLRTNSDDFSGSCREDFLPDVLLVSILCVPAASQNGKRSWEAGGVKALIMKKRPTLPSNIAGLTPMELARKIPVREAAAFNSVHVQTFLRRYRHLVHRIGERRLFVTVHDAIMLPPPDTS